MSSQYTDQQWMGIALTISRNGLGQASPNPCVGCLIVQNNRVIGRGITAPSGRPHAEAMALAQAGSAARGATAYVTLEPCSHHGKTPPCADALIQSGIERVVVAAIDPDPRVAGGGIKKLQDAGIAVNVGVGAAEANVLQQGFFKTILQKQPLVSLKIATSWNGYLDATPFGRRWITESAARQHGHLLRARHDAILTGIGTVLQDDPLLNCRLSGYEHRQPIRIILDSNLRLPKSSRIFQTAKQYKTILVSHDQHRSKASEYEKAGIEFLWQPNNQDRIANFQWVLQQLTQQYGITRILAEAGLQIADTIITGGFADDIYWYRSPWPGRAPAKLNISVLGLYPGAYFLDYALKDVRSLGPDELLIYRKEL